MHGPAGCTGTTEQTIQAALDAAAAAPGRDHVVIGDASSGPEGFTVAAGNAVDVDGDPTSVLHLDDAHRVVVDEPSAVLVGLWFTGSMTSGPLIDLRAGLWEDAKGTVTGPGTIVRLGAGTLSDTELSLAAGADVGVTAVGPGGLIQHSTIVGRQAGLVSSGGGVALRQALVLGEQAGARITGGSLTADDSAVEVSATGAAGAVGVDVAPSSAPMSVVLRSVTVAGGDRPGAVGVRAACSGRTADVSLLDTAVLGFPLDLQRAGSGCAMHLDHVGYATRDAGGGSFDDAGGLVLGPLLPIGYQWLVPWPGGGSPLVDAGSLRGTLPGETDLTGAPRVVDGDGDGAAVRDIGAVEYRRQAPRVTLDGPATVGLNSTWDFHAAAQDDDPGDRLAFSWTVDSGPAPLPSTGDSGGSTLSVGFPLPGSHVVAVTVTDSGGRRVSAARTVVVVDPAAPVAGAGDPATVTPSVPVPTVRRPPEIVFAGGRRKLTRRGVPVLMRCLLPTTCRGTLEARTFSVTSAGRLVGRASFAVRAGTSATITLRVSAATRARLRRAHRTVTLALQAYHAGPDRELWAIGAMDLLR